MPERTFRIVIQNASTTLILSQSFNHLCTGVYTPGGWIPTDPIPPGISGQLQAESSDFMGGTEGYVKYDVVTPFPTRKQGMIYIYWENPFFGLTRFRLQTDANDVAPDCDWSGPTGGGSGFSDISKRQTLPFALHFTDLIKGDAGGAEITDPSDLILLTPGPVVGVVELFALEGIDKHPELHVRVTDAVAGASNTGLTPLSKGPAGPPSMHVMTNATPADWISHWVGKAVTVDISQSGSQLAVAIADRSTTPAFSLTENFSLGTTENLSALQPVIRAQAADEAHRVALSQAAASVNRRTASSAMRASEVAGQLHSEMAKTGGPPANSEKATAAVSRELFLLTRDQKGVAYLSNNVVLRLFSVFQDGTMIGKKILFQRLGDTGDPITNAMLGFTMNIR